jgi:hypothetical protein
VLGPLEGTLNEEVQQIIDANDELNAHAQEFNNLVRNTPSPLSTLIPSYFIHYRQMKSTDKDGSSLAAVLRPASCVLRPASCSEMLSSRRG